MARKYAYAAIAVIFFGLVLVVFFSNFKLASINGELFFVELAKTQEEQGKGLGGRKNLCSKCAMLFDFKGESRRPFWMKDMNFDLDIIWILDGKIVFIEKNLKLNSNKTINPSAKADRVLEINSGLSDRYGFKIGDRVKIY